MTTYTTLICERSGDGVAVVTLNRPDRGNGVIPEMATDLVSVLDELEADTSIRCVVLTGAGKQFCAGADLVALREYLLHEFPLTHEPYNAKVLFPITQRLTTSRLIFIAAINGGATAGGLDLALACDLRVASSRAMLGETYINIGLTPGNGGTWFLPRLVGMGRATEMALTGEILDATKALEIGLVNRVVEPEALMNESIGLATKIAAKSARALEATKQALRSTWETDLKSSMNSSYWAVTALHASPDLLEGVESFLEKRIARFNQPRDDH